MSVGMFCSFRGNMSTQIANYSGMYLMTSALSCCCVCMYTCVCVCVCVHVDVCMYACVCVRPFMRLMDHVLRVWAGQWG